MKTETQRFEVNLSRTIDATPEEVYEVWLDPKIPGSLWFGAERVILDLVVDGLYYHNVHHEGHDWAHYGRFLRLEPGRVIEHTWMSEATRGIETTVTVTLEPKGQGTLLTLRHRDLPDDRLGRQHEEGWGFITDALAQRLGTRAA